MVLPYICPDTNASANAKVNANANANVNVNVASGSLHELISVNAKANAI